MPFTRNIDAAQKSVLDFWYNNNFEERISYLEGKVKELLNRRSKTFRFTDIEGKRVLLPHRFISEVEPVVTINGVTQSIGVDFVLISSSEIGFTEDLYNDDVVTVNITYMEEA